jgi:esterase
MKLFYRKFGEGQPLIILHGLFGQSDNWNTLAKQFAENGLEVYVVDQRNHGLSPHSTVWNYKAMSEDVLELIQTENLKNSILMGHSMGGKTAMQFAMDHVTYLNKLIVVDMAPKVYPLHHQSVLEALQAVDFNVVKSRKEVEAVLSHYITDKGTKQFLLKNIYWNEEEKMDWRFNLNVIVQQIDNVGEATPTEHVCDVETLFIRGENSNYILDEDQSLIQQLFSKNRLETIAESGHWVHAEKPAAFFECVMRFVK